MGYELPDKIQNRIKENFYDYLDACDTIRDIEVEIEAQKKQNVTEEIAGMMPAIKEEARADAVIRVRDEYTIASGREIYGLTTFNSESRTVNGNVLYPSSFISDRPTNDPVGEDTRLCFDDQNDKWLVRVKNGLPKLISRFVVVACLIVNASGPGICQAFVVFLKGEDKPLVFRNGIIDPTELRRQTQFHQRGLSYGRKDLYYESFLRALKMCKAVYFLTLPRHAGWNITPDGRLTFVSAAMDIPLLGGLFGDGKGQLRNVARDIILNPTERTLESTVADYHSLLPDELPIKIGTVISALSRHLPFYKEEGLVQDRLWVVETADEATAKAIIAVMQNKNHRSTEALFSSMRMPYIEEEITHYVDCVAIVRHSCTICSTHDCNKIVKYLYELLQNGYADDDIRRLVPVLFVDNAGIIPEDFQIHQISIADRLKVDSIEQILKVAGELDYYVVKLAEQNPVAVKQRIKAAVTNAKEIVLTLPRRSQSSSAVMLLSTAIMLKEGGVFKDADVQGFIDWLRTEAKSRSTLTDATCREFKSAVSGAILSGELKITKQVGPPYYSDDGYTAFIREEDKSVNMNDDTIKNIILNKTSTRSVVKMNKHLKQKGLLKGKHSNKRMFKVASDAGVFDNVEVFSYSRAVLNAEAKAFVDDIINNEFWFNTDEYPRGFVPVLYNKDGTRAAGFVFNPDDDDNLHEAYFGYTRSGKTFALTNRALLKVTVEGANAVFIFDQTGGFSPAEVDKHIGKELRMKYFAFWNVYENGVPVDLLDLRGCLSYKEKKERLTRIYAIMSRSLGSYQEPILKNAVKCMLYDMKNNPDITIHDIFNYVVQYNEDGELVLDEAHKKLRCKLHAVLDELEGTPQNKNNWGEFLKEQGKPIVVISTGADNVGKGSEIIDMMLENLYSYKQCYPDSRYTVVIDEAQDLYLHEKGAVNVLLRKGGKHRITMLLASQSFPDPNVQFGKVVGNCGRLRSYHPKADDLKRTAEYFNCGRDEVDSLKQGECYDKGPFWSRYRSENVITTLKGKTVKFEPAPNNNNNNEEDEQP